MSINYADRVKDTTTTTGTGPFTVSNSAPTGFQTFDSKFGVGSYAAGYQFPVTVDGGANWVTGYGHLSSATVVVIDTILDSSNGGAAVTFPAGSKDVLCDVPAAPFNRVFTNVPKVYRALLSQSSTSAPTATVLENTLGGTVVWTRNDAGDYSGTLTGAFTADKTFLTPPSADAYNQGAVTPNRASADVISVRTFNAADWNVAYPSDDFLSAFPLTIQVYP